MVGNGTAEKKRDPGSFLVLEHTRRQHPFDLLDLPERPGIHRRTIGGTFCLFQEYLLDPQKTPGKGLMRPSLTPAFGLLIVSACAILFWNLGKISLFDPDEGRYADMTLEMQKSGDWLVPHMNGIPHLHKPPFAMWCKLI